MKILDDKQVRQKIRRLAYEMLERHDGAQGFILVGINNNGMTFARLIYDELVAFGLQGLRLANMRVNPANPLAGPVRLDLPMEELAGQVVVMTDDVANTGRTLFYAFQPLMQVLPAKVEVAVLVDRKHKHFPVKVDYCGLSLATTLLENIDVNLSGPDGFGVYLN
ncbi:MAG: hypothetical protein RLY31_1740 [Bacteroidota bacterium]|jgi:pyrimidine operon attenuation protein/uracil phosphoribosyltransferase